MKWDWYSATVPEPPEAVLGALVAGQDLAEVVESRGLHSYARGAEVRRGERVLARAFWGGVNGEDSTHVQGSGAEAAWLVGLVRSQWPEHSVSRADVCEDWSHEKAWRWVSKITLRVAREWGVKTSTVGDWIEARDGRTLYLGAPTSQLRARVYEKGLQLGLDPHWVRFELQVRPSGAGKRCVSFAQPDQLIESSPWTRDVARGLGMPQLQAVRIRDPWVPSDDDSAMSWCIQQYGRLFERRAALLGGWDRLGEYIGASVARDVRGGRSLAPSAPQAEAEGPAVTDLCRDPQSSNKKH